MAGDIERDERRLLRVAERLRETLKPWNRCPLCDGESSYLGVLRVRGHLGSASARCRTCGHVYFAYYRRNTT